MPSLANITIKKNDGVTDITYTGIAASSGDSSPAVFRSNTVGAAVAFRPEFRLVSRPNGAKTARRVEGVFAYPETVTGTDGVTRIAERAVGSFSFLLPNGMSETTANEAAAQFLNLCAASLTKDSVKSGFAPT
jgi:hypothetical protein